ncbi:hypothetical protein COLO4_30021 [Corchorus olitorius]|uniref:Uncharacterized protein n=1 Tax=Corchorus olitorius TaxID=93759 RepID=A0A1R3HBJ9_9ROSI|nr:hypothetical protein COLO4_30021 [Corchorus olitorius]
MESGAHAHRVVSRGCVGHLPYWIPRYDSIEQMSFK